MPKRRHNEYRPPHKRRYRKNIKYKTKVRSDIDKDKAAEIPLKSVPPILPPAHAPKPCKPVAICAICDRGIYGRPQAGRDNMNICALCRHKMRS